jgi:hypothetical protein
VFVNGYLLDILVPLGFYFLLRVNGLSPFREWIVSAVFVFGAASAVEIAQLYNIPLLGRTFDLLDFGAYALGVALAVLLDTRVFPRILRFWTPEASERTPSLTEE